MLHLSGWQGNTNSTAPQIPIPMTAMMCTTRLILCTVPSNKPNSAASQALLNLKRAQRGVLPVHSKRHTVRMFTKIKRPILLCSCVCINLHMCKTSNKLNMRYFLYDKSGVVIGAHSQSDKHTHAKTWPHIFAMFREYRAEHGKMCVCI